MGLSDSCKVKTESNLIVKKLVLFLCSDLASELLNVSSYYVSDVLTGEIIDSDCNEGTECMRWIVNLSLIGFLLLKLLWKSDNSEKEKDMTDAIWFL